MATPTISNLRHMKGVGIFADLPAASAIEFRKFNLVYAFNGTGKTTLSRLLDALRDEEPSQNLPDGAEFSFTLDDESAVLSRAPANPASRFIEVFNEDYVDRSLTWKEGSAKPLIYLGEEQGELAREIAACEASEKQLAHTETLRSAEWSAAHRAAETKARDAARLIAAELNLGRRYTAANLQTDYETGSYDASDKLQDADVKSFKELIYKTDIPERISAVSNLPSFGALKSEVASALQTEVGSLAIDSLRKRQDALPWISQGIRLHQTEEECLFCGNSLDVTRMEALKAALSEGYDILSVRISDAEAAVALFLDRVGTSRHSLAGIDSAALPQFRSEIRAKSLAISSWVSAAEKAAVRWKDELARKRERGDQAYSPSENENDPTDDTAAEELRCLNTKIEEHNSEVDDFSKSQIQARLKLRKHFLADNKAAVSEARSKDESTKLTYENAVSELKKCRDKISEIRSKMREHGPAATTLNKLLKSYLGHSQIELGVNEEGYQICRGGRVSKKPLSEGEKTAVAFCYFLTNLNSEGRKLKDLIVVVDDPISSLDTRAMTHVVSLVREKFINVSQLFVLTHNLDFMREMKKWLSKKRESGEAAFLYIETRMLPGGERSSRIVEMPKLIREYESEYHYLYSLVKLLAEKPAEAEQFAYLMPNAIRKVLDIFAAFKVPGSAGLESKVDKLLKDYPNLDSARVKSMERLAQIESHAESIGDVTTFSGYTLEQVSDAAKCLLDIIAEADPGHSSAMGNLCKP